MKYRRIVVAQRGGPEVLRVVEEDLRPPAARRNAPVRVLAAAVSLPDVEARDGRSPFPPKLPFTPGYAIVGEVDAIGAGVTQAKAGDRMAALTVYGGYAEYVFVAEKKLIPVPAELDPAEVVPLILNYIVAYQTLHRSAQVRPGQTALLIGASGGIGTAYLQLGRLPGSRCTDWPLGTSTLRWQNTARSRSTTALKTSSRSSAGRNPTVWMWSSTASTAITCGAA